MIHQAIALGRIYGNLTVVGPPIRISGRIRYQCMCTCGTYTFVHANGIIKGATKSCGCKRCMSIGNAQRTHGLSRSRLYSIHKSMIGRCANEKDRKYPDYGGRGIHVCDEWKSLELFVEWALTNGYDDGLQIDRINNNKGYSPDNCRFITCTENNRNKRNNYQISAFGETKCAPAWEEDPRCAVGGRVLRQRITRDGWEAEKAIVTPSTKRKAV